MHAVLTMMRAYVVAGWPKQKIKPFGRFEQWSNLVRSTLVWLGCEDPCESRKSIISSDPAHAGLAAVLEAWFEVFDNTPRTAAEACSTCVEPLEELSPEMALRDALRAVLYNGNISPRTLGYWLRKYKDRVINGKAITQETVHDNKVAWKVMVR